ncbi:MAG: hypothetical protein JW795_14765 [Chitinivibrionales bacterium]|nr:hypothetical protein [Chitinivibrionales bacterium]
MIRTELIERSPLRILEKSTHGGVGIANIGVVAARRGIGKTACLVHIATDKLLQGKHVIHISFASNTEHILSWYEDIFSELAKRYDLDAAMAVHEEIIKNRIIMSFVQDKIHVQEIEKSVGRLLSSSHFMVDTIIIDGYDFNRSSPAEIGEFKALAGRLNVEMWFSVTLTDAESLASETEMPALLRPYLHHLAIIIQLHQRESFIHLKCVKDHDNTNIDEMHLTLDPELLLIAQKDGP